MCSQTDGAHRFPEVHQCHHFSAAADRSQQKITEYQQSRAEPKEFIKAPLKVKKGECQIGHRTEPAGAERHSGPEDYDAADSFDRRSSKGADQLEGPRAHYPPHSIARPLVTFTVRIMKENDLDKHSSDQDAEQSSRQEPETFGSLHLCSTRPLPFCIIYTAEGRG